jgi:hypothetical protein
VLGSVFLIRHLEHPSPKAKSMQARKPFPPLNGKQQQFSA